MFSRSNSGRAECPDQHPETEVGTFAGNQPTPRRADRGQHGNRGHGHRRRVRLNGNIFLVGGCSNFNGPEVLVVFRTVMSCPN